MSRHTPGTWHPSWEQPDEPNRCGVYAEIDGKEWHVATIENGAPGDTLETEKANAKLMSAAKDLLAACNKAIGAFGALKETNNLPSGWDVMVVKPILAAIAKATGEKP